MAANDLDFEEIEPSNALGNVRALIPDTEKLGDPANPSAAASYLFSDNILGRYMVMTGAELVNNSYTANTSQSYRAAALACEALARSEMLILKKITTEDLATDGATLANQYRQLAKQLRDEADRLEANDVDDEPGMFTHAYQRTPAQFDADATARGMIRWA